MIESNWYRTDEVCQILGYSRRHIYRLMKNGLIAYYKPNGGSIFFKKDDIDGWLEKGRCLTNDEVSQITSTYLYTKHS